MGVKDLIKKSVALMSALAMSFSMITMPAKSVFAESEGGTTTDDALKLGKSAELQSDGTYKISLEAYAKGEVKVDTTTTTVPCDIVLVLDQSGSMAYDFNGNSTNSNSSRRQYALKQAATNFINNVSTNAKNSKVDHKIALVTFGSNSSIISGSEAASTSFVSLYSENNPDQNTNGTKSLLSNISSLHDKPSGSTQIDLGMNNAKSIMDANPVSSNEKRNRIVVVFTDGYPTTSNGFEQKVADSAIGTAKSLKDGGTTVYTIGIFTGADVDELYGSLNGNVGSTWDSENRSICNGNDAAANRFLNYLSSNFNAATSLGLEQTNKESGWFNKTYYYNYKISSTFNRDSSKYYMTASNQTELNNIFETISNDIVTGGTTVELDQTAVAKDIVSDNFDLPEGFSKDNIKVYTADYKGNDTWGENQVFTDATVNINTTNKLIGVSNFNYKENYVAEATDKTEAKGKKLIIEIYGVTANKSGLDIDTNTEDSAVYDGEGTLVKRFPQPKVDIDSKSYVLDYGKTVSTAASDYGVSAVTIANTGKPSPYDVNLNGDYGTFAISSGNLNYTPGKINWDGIDTGYVFGQKTSSTEYKWEQVNFIPATSVYYEDDFAENIESNDSSVKIQWTGDWTKVNSTDTTTGNQSSYNEKYGWDDSYADDAQYSNGSAHQTSSKGATATFTFTGTGVDIYSRTDNFVGKAYAKLSGATKENQDVTINKGLIVDNNSSSGTYYQIPTLSFDDLEYGTYTVKITVMSGSTDNATYYLDGIRVYNPLGTVDDNSTAGKAYEEAGESNAQYIQLRKDLIDNTVVEEISSSITGSVFIDKTEDGQLGQSTNIIGTYKDYGPKNEVYLANGQGVAFNVDGYNSNTKVFIGLKAPSGEGTTVEVTKGTGKETLNINSAADLYYEITPDANGNVVIENTGDNLLSVTKVRLTNSNSSITSYSLKSTPELMSYVDSFSKLSIVEEQEDDVVEDTTLNEDDVNIENPIEEDQSGDNSSSEKDETNTSNSFWKQIVNSISKLFGRK